MQYIFLVLFLAGYGLLNYYVGLRGFQSVNAQIRINKAAYWIIVFFFASMYILGVVGKNHLPDIIATILNTLGGYWLAALVYLIGFVVIIDIFRLLAKRFDFMPDIIKNNTWFIAFSVVAIVGIILAIGTYNAIVPTVVTYNVDIDKKAGNMEQLKVAMISDVHLSETIGRDRLHRAVEVINKIEPDIVVITGDLIDNDLEVVKKANMLRELKNIKSRYGVYAILGNHEYYGKKTDEIARMIEDTGVIVLRDKCVKIQDSFYLAGREDNSSVLNGYNRLELKELLTDVDNSLPIILLDHEPINLDEPRKQGVDLQMSGHTHEGQFFPISLITDLIYEEDCGYLKDGKFNLIVSCGYGTWGPTVRIGSQSEVLDITINFKK